MELRTLSQKKLNKKKKVKKIQVSQIMSGQSNNQNMNECSTFIINLKILTARQMDYNMLYSILPKPYIKWSVSDMEKFLNFIGLPSLFAKFKQLSIDGSCLNTLTQQDLKEELEIKSTITIKKLMQWIKRGLYEYQQYLTSRTQPYSAQSQNLASMTQKPKIAKISSMKEEDQSQDIIKRSSYKSVPETQVQNQANFKNQNYKPIEIENSNSQKMELEESSMISEPEEDKKKQFELIIQQSDGPQTSFFSVKQEGAKIGRHSSNQILILDESISRFHAEIKFEENIFLLRDTGSTTGTFIKLIGKAEITNNMIIQMGSNQFQARLEDELLTLEIIEGPSLGYSIEISNHKKVTVGRKQTNLLNFPQDQHLSNVHAAITPIGEKFFVEDMGTTNGTWRRLSYEGEVSPLFEISDKGVFKIGSSQTYVCTIKTTFVSQKTHPNACIICYENDKDCVYMPCKHNAACIRCSKNLKECPICRLKIDDFVRIYKN